MSSADFVNGLLGRVGRRLVRGPVLQLHDEVGKSIRVSPPTAQICVRKV